jgi:hypothetical protein
MTATQTHGVPIIVASISTKRGGTPRSPIERGKRLAHGDQIGKEVATPTDALEHVLGRTPIELARAHRSTPSTSCQLTGETGSERRRLGDRNSAACPPRRSHRCGAHRSAPSSSPSLDHELLATGPRETGHNVAQALEQSSATRFARKRRSGSESARSSARWYAARASARRPRRRNRSARAAWK